MAHSAGREAPIADLVNVVVGWILADPEFPQAFGMVVSHRMIAEGFDREAIRIFCSFPSVFQIPISKPICRSKEAKNSVEINLIGFVSLKIQSCEMLVLVSIFYGVIVALTSVCARLRN